MDVAASPFLSKPPSPLGLRLSGLNVVFDGKPLFEDFHLEIEAARTVCLLGPSGVGKSSLLRTIAGLSGGVVGAQVICSDGKPPAQRIAWMDQRDQLLPWLSAHGNVTLGCRLRGERPDFARASALLQAVGLAGEADQPPRALSGGMRQRVALARTLYEDRPIVLLDEPFASLDAIARHRLQQLAARLLAGRTVVMVTHDPWEALLLGEEIHVLAGRPVRLGTPLRPDGPPPRHARLPELAPLYRELLERLAAADAEQ